MGSFRLTKLALADFRSIGRYTQTTWGRVQRDTYLGKIDQAFHMLAQDPQRGRACVDILPTPPSGCSC
jgi:toxin ParE1/3/4